jgi:hypothetical protein
VHFVIWEARGDALHRKSWCGERASDRIGAVFPKEAKDFVRESRNERDAKDAARHGFKRIEAAERCEGDEANQNDDNKKLGAAAWVCGWPARKVSARQLVTVL